MNARTSLILLLFFGWSAGSWYWYTCKIKGFCPGANVQTEIPAPEILKPLVNIGPLAFKWSDAAPVTNNGFATFKTELLSQLKDNQVLQIIGKYYPGEANHTSFDNLGIARAERIKALLTDALDVEKIETKGQLLEPVGSQEGLFEAAGFRYQIRSKVVQEIDDAILIYFPFNSSEKEVNPEIDNYLNNLTARLKNSDETVSVIGHTDNAGDDKANYQLGLDRAKSVKDILITKGINASRITASSQGENAPIASNDTDEGRHRNRRIELQVE